MVFFLSITRVVFMLPCGLQVEVLIVSLFITPENGILIQDSFALHHSHNSLLGLEAPYFYFTKKV